MIGGEFTVKLKLYDDEKLNSGILNITVNCVIPGNVAASMYNICVFTGAEELLFEETGMI